MRPIAQERKLQKGIIMMIKQLDKTEIIRISEIDRTEKIKLLYKYNKGKLETESVDIDVPRWDHPD